MFEATPTKRVQLMCEPASWSREPIFASHCVLFFFCCCTEEFKNLIQSESPTCAKFCLFPSVHSFRCEWNFGFPLRNADYENWLTSKYKQGNVVRRNWEQRHLRFICFFLPPRLSAVLSLGKPGFNQFPRKIDRRTARLLISNNSKVWG